MAITKYEFLVIKNASEATMGSELKQKIDAIPGIHKEVVGVESRNTNVLILLKVTE